MTNLTGKGKLNLMREDKILKILEQSGKVIDKKRDKARMAKLPGKRVSKKGEVYWETRKNRSDALLKNL